MTTQATEIGEAEAYDALLALTGPEACEKGCGGYTFCMKCISKNKPKFTKTLREYADEEILKTGIPEPRNAEIVVCWRTPLEFHFVFREITLKKIVIEAKYLSMALLKILESLVPGLATVRRGFYAQFLPALFPKYQNDSPRWDYISYEVGLPLIEEDIKRLKQDIENPLGALKRIYNALDIAEGDEFKLLMDEIKGVLDISV